MIELRPITRDDAGEVLRRWHRHHKRVQGHRFAIAAYSGDELVGVVIVGNPKAKALNDGTTFEVTRLCTNGHRNAASRLLGAAWKAAKAMGVRRMVSYLRSDEEGVCYRAAGWTVAADVQGREWDKYTDSARRQKTLPGIIEPTTEVIDRQRWEIAA